MLLQGVAIAMYLILDYIYIQYCMHDMVRFLNYNRYFSKTLFNWEMLIAIYYICSNGVDCVTVLRFLKQQRTNNNQFRQRIRF